MNIEVPITYFKEAKSFVAYAPALDLSSAGNTLKEAEKNIKEATELFIEEILDKNTINEVLFSLGWTRITKTKQWIPPTLVAHGLLPITL